jgi:hypothetical protein
MYDPLLAMIFQLVLRSVEMFVNDELERIVTLFATEYMPVTSYVETI